MIIVITATHYYSFYYMTMPPDKNLAFFPQKRYKNSMFLSARQIIFEPTE